MSKLVEEMTKNNTIHFDEFSEEGNYKYRVGRGKEYKYNKNGTNRSNYWKFIIDT